MPELANSGQGFQRIPLLTGNTATATLYLSFEQLNPLARVDAPKNIRRIVDGARRRIRGSILERIWSEGQSRPRQVRRCCHYKRSKRDRERRAAPMTPRSQILILRFTLAHPQFSIAHCMVGGFSCGFQHQGGLWR